MSPPITISLGGQAFAIKPLTIGQFEDISALHVAPIEGDAVARITAQFQRMRETIAAALSEDHPEITADALRKLRATPDEFRAAYGKVLQLSGLVTEMQEPTPGEASAGAAPAPASTGTGSTGG